MRVYMDGCFDVMHYGHANALRQVPQHLPKHHSASLHAPGNGSQCACSLEWGRCMCHGPRACHSRVPVLAQARALGDELVVGLISDDEIRAAKGPPVQNYEERKTLVGAVKWVDEIIDGARWQGPCITIMHVNGPKWCICTQLILYSHAKQD